MLQARSIIILEAVFLKSLFSVTLNTVYKKKKYLWRCGQEPQTLVSLKELKERKITASFVPIYISQPQLFKGINIQYESSCGQRTSEQDRASDHNTVVEPDFMQIKAD